MIFHIAFNLDVAPGELESPAATLLVPKELEPSATVTWH
jgi:hypothetical protein